MAHQIESLLRPPVELAVTAVHGACAMGALFGYQALLMTPSVAVGTAACLFGTAVYWFRGGMSVVRYRNNILKQSLFELEHIPANAKRLYLGRGFRWKAIHTQRLHDTRQTRFERYLQPPFGKKVDLDSEDPDGEVYGDPCLHGVEPNERDVTIAKADNRGHTLVVGTTGVGKTRSLEVMVDQSIESGDPTIVIDPKGDADVLIGMKQSCEEHGREFVMFHLGYPEISAKYNGVGDYNRVTEVASRITEQMSKEGNSVVFTEMAWRFINAVARVLTSLGIKPSYANILKHIEEKRALLIKYADHLYQDDLNMMAMVAFKEQEIIDACAEKIQAVPADLRYFVWVSLLTGRDDLDSALVSLKNVCKYSEDHFEKLIASLMPLLDKLTTGKAGELLSPDYRDVTDGRPVLDLDEFINKNQVWYIGLDALSDPVVASAVGNSMLSELVSFGGARYKFGDNRAMSPGSTADQMPIKIYLDEFTDLMGDAFIPFLNKCGGAGMHITAFTQTYSDIQAKILMEAKAKQVRGNFNTLIMLKVQDIETARMLTDKLYNVSVNDLMSVSGYTDSSDPDSAVDFVSNSEDRYTSSRVPLLEAADITLLPKGQAFAILKGGAVYKIRLPLKKMKRNVDFSDAFMDVTRDMKARYRTGLNWAQLV